MMKKVCCVLLCLTMLLGAFSAFAEGPVEIEYWFGLGGKLGDLFISLIDEYNASQDKVRVTGVQYADYFTLRQSYQAALASGTEPACMHTQIGNIPGIESYLEPLNDRYENDADFHAEDLLAGCISCMYDKDGETLLGVPLFASSQVMYYRLDAFEGYDIEETFSTWQNLYKVLKEISKKDEAGNTIFYGWEPMWKTYNFVDAVHSAGGEYFTDLDCKTVNFLAPEWVDVMTFFSNAFKEGIMTMNHGGTGWEYWYKNIDDVIQGRAAGYTGSPGDMGDLDFTIVGCHSQPGFGDHGVASTTDAHLGVISRRIPQEKKDAAWDFLKFLNSNHVQALISMNGGYVVTRKTALEDPEFAAYCKENPQVPIVIGAVENAIKLHVDPTGGYGDNAYYDMCDRVLLEGVDVIEALTICQEEAQAALDEYWADKD